MKMRKNRQIPFKPRPRFVILVDGECELWYFQMLKRNERALPIDLQPEIPQKKALKDQFAKAIRLSEDYDKVFWIIDYDVVVSESRQAKKGHKPASQELQEYCAELESKHTKVTVIINNSCLEFWFLLHFELTGKTFNNCDTASRHLSKYLNGYEKTQRYYTRQGDDIYLKLKPYLTTAVSNAKKLGDFYFNAPKSTSQMQALFGAAELSSVLLGEQ